MLTLYAAPADLPEILMAIEQRKMTEQKFDRDFGVSRYRKSTLIWGMVLTLCVCAYLGFAIFANDFQHWWTQRRIDSVKAYYSHIMEIAFPSDGQLLMTELTRGPEIAPVAPRCIFAHHSFILGSNQDATALLSEFEQKLGAVGWIQTMRNCTPEGYCRHSYNDPEKKMSATITIWTKDTLGKHNGSAYFQWDQWRTQHKTIFGLAFLYTDGCDLQ